MKDSTKKDVICHFVNTNEGVISEQVWKHLSDMGHTFNTLKENRQKISVSGMLSDLFFEGKIDRIPNPDGRGYIWKRKSF